MTVKQAQNNVLQVEEGVQTTFEVEKAGRQIEFFVPGEHQAFGDGFPGRFQGVGYGRRACCATAEGSGDLHATVTVAANDGEPRNATVTLSDPDNASLKIELTVSQDGETPLPEGMVRIRMRTSARSQVAGGISSVPTRRSAN